MNKGVLKVYLDDKQLIDSIFEALKPDDHMLPSNISLSYVIEPNCIIINITCKNNVSIGTLLNILDELITSIYACIKSIRALRQTYK
ncbi:MAG: hypothetical protein NZ926_01225 [Candidatus Methanomethylicia archaeon]|nr:hypothetical protein [Candidatus Methanomethylicia archaeon]MCX8169052.1 hypothetical protein [Candidatus Methanomethylicia archaeon]MDW7988784.1 hypothetical protein [Nitrososphaerota archaeon]